VVIDLCSDVFDNALPQPVGRVGVEIVGDSLYQKYSDNKQRHQQQAIRIGRYDVMVECVLNKDGSKWRQCSNGNGEHEREYEPPSVRTNIFQNPAEKVHVECFAGDLAHVLFRKMLFGYSTRDKNSPLAGTERPASDLFFEARMSSNSCKLVFP